jgi:hypothetical protein
MFLGGQGSSGLTEAHVNAPMSIAGDVPPGPGSVLGSLPSHMAHPPATTRAATAAASHGVLPTVYSSRMQSGDYGGQR